MKKTRKVTPLSTRAEVGAVDAKARTVDVTWTTGARVLRSSWADGPFWEELSLDPRHVKLDRLNAGAPFLPDHNSRDVAATLGVIERGSAKIENGKGVARVRFAAEGVDPVADQVFAKVRDGIIANVSVGYRIAKMEKVADGTDGHPVFRAVDWTPMEVSAVCVGADAGAGFRSDAETNDVEFFNPLTPQPERTVDPEELKKQQEAAAALAKRQAEELEAATLRAVKAERDRVSTIDTVVRGAGLDATFAAPMIADGSTVEKARELVLNELARRSDEFKTNRSPIVGVPGQDNRDKWVRGVSAALFARSSNGLVAQAVAKNLPGFEGVDVGGGEFRGMSLLDIARACVERNGGSTRGVYDRMKLIDMALEQRSGYAGATTSDFAVLFENVLNKSMRAGYATQSDTWRRFCGTDTVSDFREAHRFLNGSFGTLPVVPEGAEYTNAAIPDGAKTSISVETRGQIIALSRQAIINDDMSALTDIATRFGLTGARSIEVAVYALLALNSGLGPTMADGQPFFHANRSNVSTGSALSGAALDADRLVMRQQKDISSNDYLDLMPRIALVPIQVETALRAINEAAFDHDGTKLQKPNMQRGMFGDIVSSPRLSWSTTRRYMFTEAKEALKVVFLEGSGEGPTLESRQGFRTDGIEWKARLDFKAVPYDPKTAVTNAGQ